MRVYLINYDNGSRVPVAPQNLYHLEKIINNKTAHASNVLDFNATKDPYEYLFEIARADIKGFGRQIVFGLGFISGYWPHKEAIKIAKIIKEIKAKYRDNVKFIIGGHAPTAAPDFYMWLLGADACFLGAADKSLVEWLDNPVDGMIESKGYDIDISQTIDHNDLSIYKRVRFPNTKDDEFCVQILSARGCPYSCAFCHRIEKGAVLIPVKDIIGDISIYAIEDKITHFQFSDELLMSSRKRCADVCRALIRLQDKIGRKLHFDCNGRLNLAAGDEELLKLMKEAGFRYINYGCESMNQDVLDGINKNQTVSQIVDGVENTLAAGLSPGLNFMWGCPNDTEDTLWKAAEFIDVHNDGCELRTIRPVTPYPGTPLFDELGITVSQFYEKHTNSDLFSFHFMDGLTNAEANQHLCAVNTWLYERYAERKIAKERKRLKDFYYGNSDSESFRGFREV